MPRSGYRRAFMIPEIGDPLHPESPIHFDRNQRSTSSEIRIFEAVVRVCLSAAIGSSPLARGTLMRSPFYLILQRFIPARAGNTSCIFFVRAFQPVHPRSRGEHRIRSICARPNAGSSPLARGTHPRPVDPVSYCRFIPARAGNTLDSRLASLGRPVHPRSRGEHLKHPFSARARVGSSPLARGTPLRAVECCGLLRFIPARAGNTGSACRRAPKVSVHPRSRGEHPPDHLPSSRESGSSPLARGTRDLSPPGCPPVRFIPARAGNTLKSGLSAIITAVHPRSRGEHPFP